MRSGPSAAFPNLCARHSHDNTRKLDVIGMVTQDCGNRTSRRSDRFATPSYREALSSCAGIVTITRSGRSVRLI